MAFTLLSDLHSSSSESSSSVILAIIRRLVRLIPAVVLKRQKNISLYVGHFNCGSSDSAPQKSLTVRYSELVFGLRSISGHHFSQPQKSYQSVSPLKVSPLKNGRKRRMMLALGLPRAVRLGFWWRNLPVISKVVAKKCCVWMILASNVINRFNLI